MKEITIRILKRDLNICDVIVYINENPHWTIGRVMFYTISVFGVNVTKYYGQTTLTKSVVEATTLDSCLEELSKLFIEELLSLTKVEWTNAD